LFHILFCIIEVSRQFILLPAIKFMTLTLLYC